MWKSAVLALFATAVAGPSLAQANGNGFDRAMNTAWEVLWHQSGTATRVVRWEQEVKVRVYGYNLAAHKQYTLQALRDVAAEAGVKLTDVSDRPDAATAANVSIEIVPSTALSDNQPCETRLDFKTETTLDTVTTQMRDSDARRCVYHEAMHMMGVRGHPDGDTVLSYFTTRSDGLRPLDKAMLHAWYSPRTRAGMTPFEFLPVLADQVVAMMPSPEKAKPQRDGFLARTVLDMQAFAAGQGEVPTIIKRCGKMTDVGVAYGRREMSYFLGVAYLQGATVPQDPTQAVRWLQLAASQGSRSAKAGLTAMGAAVAGKG